MPASGDTTKEGSRSPPSSGAAAKAEHAVTEGEGSETSRRSDEADAEGRRTQPFEERGPDVPPRRGEPGVVRAETLADGRALTDAMLAARAGRGDAEAFRMLLDRHLSAVVAIARRMLRDDAEAEDVAQEAMLRLWRTGADLELGAAGARPWLRRVVSNLCIDRIRSGQRTEVTDEVPDVETPPGQLRELMDRELAARVDSELKSLPERQRLALTLFHFEGMSQLEVAEVMGISDEAVESLLARARRALKAGLKLEWRQLLSEGK